MSNNGEIDISAAAAELGRLGGKKGGKARAAKLTPEERRAIAVSGAQKRWGKKTNNPCCNYAHYYVGSRYRFTYPDGSFVEAIMESLFPIGMMFGDDISINKKDDPANKFLNLFEINDFRKDGNFQLFLRDQSSLTAEEKRDYKNLCYTCRDIHGGVLRIVDTPFSLDYLFRNSIDAFDLIENGHAIEIV